MPNDLLSVEQVAERNLRDRVEASLPGLTREERTRALAVALFVFGAALMLMYRPFSQSEVGDSAGYDYIAQSILRGQLPYRDVVDMKTPGSMYLSALAMGAGKLAGLRDIIAVRLFQSLLVGLLCVVTFYVSRAYLGSTPAALIGAAFPLISSKFAEWMVVGTQPKLAMILFGMLSLLFIARDRPVWAGLTSMLSFLCWQPGLMFTGVAVLMFSRYLTRWRDLRVAGVVLGAAVPLAIVLAYFYSRGALDDLWAWTITFNYSVFGPETQRAPLQALNHIWSVTKRVFGLEAVAALLGIVGFALFAVQRVRGRAAGKKGDEHFKDALLIPPVVYFAFCLVNFQAGPDLIPFIPFFGMFSASLIVQAEQFVSSREQSRTGDNRTSTAQAFPRARFRWDLIVPGTAAALILFVALIRAASYRIPPGFALQDQDRQFTAIAQILGPQDALYVHGYAELLVFLDRPNLNPYTFLTQGIDSFASVRRSRDFSSIVAEMEAERPKLVALSRLQNVKSRDLIQRWVDEHYDRMESFTHANVYIRRAQ